jgi:hypothetical protein
MSDWKHILVASDLSSSADQAVARAVQLVAAHGSAMLTVFRVLHDSAQNDKAVQQINDRSGGGLYQNIKALLRRNRAVVIRLATGKPVVEILRRAPEEAIDLAVIGVLNQYSTYCFFVTMTVQFYFLPSSVSPEESRDGDYFSPLRKSSCCASRRTSEQWGVISPLLS